MVKDLFSYKRGSLRIRVTGGSYDRFLNLCANHGIALWNLEYHGGAYEMDISLPGFRMLRPLARKSGSRVRILKRRGLPFSLYRYRKRKMLAAGLLFGICVMFLLSRFLWNIEIEGNQRITEGKILRYLEEEHIVIGSRLSVIDCKELSAALRRAFQEFTWVSVKQEGTRLFIQVQENTDAPSGVEKAEDTSPADLVSDKNGVVVSIITRKGVPQVAAGDTVKKGDILVKGVLDIVNDSEEVVSHQFCHADADVLVKTTYQYQERIPVTQKEKQYTGRKKTKYYIKLGERQISFPSGSPSFSLYDTVGENTQLCLFGNFCLPFFWCKTQYLEYEFVPVTRSQKSVFSEAEDNLYKFLTKIQEKGVQIFKNNVRIETDGTDCVAKGSVILIEKAGKSVERTTAE